MPKVCVRLGWPYVYICEKIIRQGTVPCAILYHCLSACASKPKCRRQIMPTAIHAIYRNSFSSALRVPSNQWGHSSERGVSPWFDCWTDRTNGRRLRSLSPAIGAVKRVRLFVRHGDNDQRFPKFVIGLERRQILTVRQFFLLPSSPTGSGRKRTTSERNSRKNGAWRGTSPCAVEGTPISFADNIIGAKRPEIPHSSFLTPNS